MAIKQKLIDLIEPIVASSGIELVDIELSSQDREQILQILIDKPGGVTLDDCSQASRQIASVMDVEDPIAERYRLEVSSPGLNRPLRTLEQVQQFIGETAKLKLRRPNEEGQRNFKGVIEKVEGSKVYLRIDDALMDWDFEAVDKMNLRR